MVRFTKIRLKLTQLNTKNQTKPRSTSLGFVIGDKFCLTEVADGASIIYTPTPGKGGLT